MAEQSALKLIEKQKEIAVQIEHKRSSAVKYGSKRTKEVYERSWLKFRNYGTNSCLMMC